jgi:hypothetical protein
MPSVVDLRDPYRFPSVDSQTKPGSIEYRGICPLGCGEIALWRDKRDGKVKFDQHKGAHPQSIACHWALREPAENSLVLRFQRMLQGNYIQLAMED